MIAWRYPLRRLRALVSLLGVLGGCVGVGVYKPAGARTVDERPTPAHRAPTSVEASPTQEAVVASCSRLAMELIDLINAYRAENSLATIPASPSLCTVAAAHTRDLAAHAPHTQPGCNLHSWRDKGDWT